MGRLLFVRNTGRVMVLKWLLSEAGIGHLALFRLVDFRWG